MQNVDISPAVSPTPGKLKVTAGLFNLAKGK